MLGWALYVALGMAYLAQRALLTGATYGIYADKLLYYVLVLVPLVAGIWWCFVAAWHAPRAPLGWMRRTATPEALARFVVGLALLLLLIPFLGTFTQIKGSLSLGGFGSELQVADWERALHGGVDAAEWLAATLGQGPLRLAEVNYNVGWQAYHLLFITLMLVHPAFVRLRALYLALYGAVWVLLGNVLAGMFVSAGPAFYEAVTGDAQRFAVLTQMLEAGREHVHSAWRLQQYLWAHWQAGSSALGTGISAFPSVHIAVVTVNALVLWRYVHRAASALAMLYAVLILVSSAYLGWHYLIDGYVAAAVSALLVTYAGRLYRQRY